MQATVQANPAGCRVSWRRVLANLSVTYVWAYDTVAILDDYYDSQPGILPAGQLIRLSAAADNPGLLICDLDDPRFIEREQLPHGRVFRFRPWSFATRLQAVVATADYDAETVEASRLAWPRRFVRAAARRYRA